MKVLGRISVREKGAGMHGGMGAKLQSHIPAQVKMGYIFRKKIWVHYTQDLKKKGYIFREQSLKMGTFSCQNDP